MMRVWLCRDESGFYSLAKRYPIAATILGTDRRAWYFVVGEPVGWRNMCSAVVAALCGRDIGMAPLSEPISVEALLIPSANITAELRRAIVDAQNIDPQTQGETIMADQVRPPYTPPPDDTRIATTTKEQFTLKLTSYVNSSQALAVLSQANRDKLIVDVVAIAFPTITTTQTR